MERFEGFDKNIINFLKTYNFIKKDNVLIKLAEELNTIEEKAINNKDFQTLEVFQDIEDNLKQIALDIMRNTTVSNLIEKEQIMTKKKVRVYMDGVFDIIHSGHFNALRQAKRLGDILVVGINSDEDVEKAKGPTLMNVYERAALAGACKWVDEIEINTPYSPTLELLDQFNIDFCAHGEDPCFNELGEDVYGPMKKVGRYREFKRTEGISTTEIVGRLLSLTKEIKKSTEGEVMTSSDLLLKFEDSDFTKGPVVSCFLTTGRRLHEFCNNKIPKDTDKVVYIDGAWDILHIGHIEILKKAKELGDFLYVGVHDDATVNKHRGKNYPIINLQERVFNLLALKYVDDVVISAPWEIKEDLIKTLKISIVAQGTKLKYDLEFKEDIFEDPYAYCKTLGIYKEIKSDYEMDSEVLVKRIFDKRDHYIKKYQKKSTSETKYYENREYKQEI